VLESLTGAVVGSAVAFGIYSAACDDEPCVGGAVGGLVANVAITPVAVWGVGRAVGGEGSLGATYLLGMAAFSGGAAAPQAPLLGLIIGVTLMPFTSALGFELSSNAKAQTGIASVRPNVTPLYRGEALAGATGGLVGQF
jgi:hypothetical protein